MDRSNAQIDFDNVDTTPGSPTQGAHTEETRNSPGLSKIRGFEADLTALITDGVTVGVSYAYTDVKIPLRRSPSREIPWSRRARRSRCIRSTPRKRASAYVDYAETPVRNMTFRTSTSTRTMPAGNTLSRPSSPTCSPTGSLVQNVAVKTDPSFIVNGNVALAGHRHGAAAARRRTCRSGLETCWTSRTSTASRPPTAARSATTPTSIRRALSAWNCAWPTEDLQWQGRPAAAGLAVSPPTVSEGASALTFGLEVKLGL